MRLLSGSSALRALYSSGLQQVDPWWPLDSASSLRSWLSDQSQRWVVDDPCFAAQRAIGEAELSAGEAYQELVRRHESALAAYLDSPGRAEVESKEKALSSTEHAIAGLRAFIAGADAPEMRKRQERAAMKLQSFTRSHTECRADLDAARSACNEWAALQAASTALEARREEIGLPRLHAKARALEQQKGMHSHKGGHRFERAAGAPMLGALQASMRAELREQEEEKRCLVVLNSVTLGMAKAEIDLLFCTVRNASETVQLSGGKGEEEGGGGGGGGGDTDHTGGSGGGGDSSGSGAEIDVELEVSPQRKQRRGQLLPDGIFLDAIALCEVKRDPSDLGSAVSKSREVMAWLAGDTHTYDAEEWVNKHHPSGHFGVGADGKTLRAHALAKDGITYLFDRESFALFRMAESVARGPGSLDVTAQTDESSTRDQRTQPRQQPSLPPPDSILPPRLHVVTSNRRLRPLPSRAYNRVQHKAARDVKLIDALCRKEAADAYNWEALRVWLREQMGPLSAIGALRLFAEHEAAAAQLHVEAESV